MPNYIMYNGIFYDSGELYHYGVPGMKWGVRKEVYKSMNRQEKRNARDTFYKTEGGQRSLKASTHASVWGTVLGGPLIGVVAGLTTNAIMNRKANELIASKQTVSGKNTVQKMENKKVSDLSDPKNSTKTESKKVASLKQRVTGRKENGKPAFLMTKEEMADFSARYDQRKAGLKKRLNSTTKESDRKKIISEMDRLENDYLSIVEQDFWYSDD